MGTNANFIFIDEGNVVHIRTFEKGVEAETEACGTGTIASALIVAVTRGLRPPIQIETRNGDILTVGFEERENVPLSDLAFLDAVPPALFATDLYFEGNANLVFTGSVSYISGSTDLRSRS